MSEHASEELVVLSPQERAARHLVAILRSCNPIELRDSVDTILWDANEHADWMSDEGVRDAFNCRELAQASFRYGATSFRQSIPPEFVLKHFDSRPFQSTQKAVCDRVEDPRARSVWFFSQGVKFGSMVLRSQRLSR